MSTLRRYVGPPLLFFILASLAGCFKLPSASVSVSQANQKLIDICKQDYKLEPSVSAFANTVWLYLPVDHPILELKASTEDAQKSNQSSPKLSVKYADSRMDAGNIVVDYDIVTDKVYPQSYGYMTGYNEAYNEKYNHLLTAIYRAYADVGVVAGDVTFSDQKKQATHEQLVKSHVPTEKPPDFFVIVISDVVRGLEARAMFHFQDFKQRMVGVLMDDEFAKRLITDYEGSQRIINDNEGRHLNKHDILLPEFVTKQIVHRINFRFGQSSLPPPDDVREEISRLVTDTVYAYHFTDYQKIQLNDLNKGTTSTVGK